MKTLRNESDKAEILDRLAAFTPEQKPLWGHMNSPQMLAHVADPLRCALGEITAPPTGSFLRFTPLKQLIIYWLPWPKGAPTVPEFLHPDPGDWNRNRTELLALIDRFAQTAGRSRIPPHPLFGKLSGRSWGVLMWRHLDHHLRQFGA